MGKFDSLLNIGIPILMLSIISCVQNGNNKADRVKWGGIFPWLRAPPKLNPALKPEYELILAISQCK